MTVIVVAAVMLVLLVVGLHRDPAQPRRFGIALRRSHLHGSARRPWRWTVHPIYCSLDVVDLLTGGNPTTRTTGRARTYAGAWHAAARARRALEAELAADRARFLEDMQTDHRLTAELFPAEIDADYPAGDTVEIVPPHDIAGGGT